MGKMQRQLKEEVSITQGTDALLAATSGTEPGGISLTASSHKW